MGGIGILCFILACFIVLPLYAKRIHSFVLIGLIVASLFIPAFPRVLSGARDRVYGFEKIDDMVFSISHTLYIALGSQSNPWGIVYDDSYAFQKAVGAYPGIKIFSKAYYDYMWEAYFDALRVHPWAAVKIYAGKLAGVFWNAAEVLIMLILLIFLSLKSVRGQLHSNYFIVLAWVGFTATMLVLFQGFIAVNDRKYLYPAEIGWVLLWSLIGESLNSHGWKWSCRLAWAMAVLRVGYAMLPLELGKSLVTVALTTMDVLHYFLPFGLLMAVIVESIGRQSLIRKLTFRQPTSS